MDLEQRLRSHLQETGRDLRIEPGDPHQIMVAPPPRTGRVVQVAAVLVILAVAGAVFLVASGGEQPTTEVAAGSTGDVERADEADGATGDGIALAATHRTLQVVDLGSDNGPGYGLTVVDQGIYYVLSTPPGEPEPLLAEGLDPDIALLGLRNTLHVLDENGWTSNPVGDRFVSDFDVRDGVIHLLSPGSPTSDRAAIGRSEDRGQTWEWTEVDGLASVDALSILATDDQPVIAAASWGRPFVDEALALASQAGLDIPDVAVLDITNDALTYRRFDPDAPCDVVYDQYLPGYAETIRYFSGRSPAELGLTSAAEMEQILEGELEWVVMQLEDNDCPLPDDASDWPSSPRPDEVITVRWSDLGVEVPEEWRPWFAVYRFDGTDLVQAETPFATSGEVWLARVGDRLQISVSNRPDGDGATAVPGENVYLTADGRTWTEEFRPHPDNDAAILRQLADYTDPVEFLPPIAGDALFRLQWDEANLVVESPAMVGDLAYELEPELQRLTPGADWETIDLARLLPDVEIGDRVIQDVRGSSVGVLVMLAPTYGADGQPLADSTIVAYSGDGAQWGAVELPGESVFHFNGDDEVLVMIGQTVDLRPVVATAILRPVD
ncbi:MAG: hypothetical protein AAF547_11135 [Actinomycetota bacterium]